MLRANRRSTAEEVMIGVQGQDNKADLDARLGAVCKNIF